MYVNILNYLFIDVQFSVPNLMDGRDLFDEICKDYKSQTKIFSIVNDIPKFIVRRFNNYIILILS